VEEEHLNTCGVEGLRKTGGRGGRGKKQRGARRGFGSFNSKAQCARGGNKASKMYRRMHWRVSRMAAKRICMC